MPIPRGIVIPWLLEGQLWQLKIRTNREQPKYLAISGGHPCLCGADTLVPGEPAILTEGEFDTMLLWQEAGDLVGVATLGSCNRGVSIKALRYLLGCPRLLVAYDVDAEGEKGAERLAQVSPRMHRIRPQVGKDVTAFWQAGGRVRDWIRFDLARLAAVPADGVGARRRLVWVGERDGDEAYSVRGRRALGETSAEIPRAVAHDL